MSPTPPPTSPCLGYLCFGCVAQPEPGCASCIDGFDLDHAEQCRPCRDVLADQLGGTR